MLNKGLLGAFASGQLSYREFAAEVHRRKSDIGSDAELYGEPADWEP